MSWLKKRWAATVNYLRSGVNRVRGTYLFKKKTLLVSVRIYFRQICRDLSDLQDAIGVFLRRTHYGVMEEKETFIVAIGVVEGTSDKRRTIAFEGSQVAQRVYAEGIKRITETLYWIGYNRFGSKRYLIHTRTLYRIKGLRTVLDMREVREADLALGRYAQLGRLRPLNLAEALKA